METNKEDLSRLKTDLQRHLEKRLIKGDTWYLIANHWLKQCKMYFGFEGTMYDSGGTEHRHPGPIDNRSLFKDDASGEIRDHMIDELEYVFVPEEGWNMLVEEFGLEMGQEPIARKVVEHGMFVKHCKIEVYYIEFQLAENSNLESFVKKKFSKADTLEYIQKVMREEFSIDERVETRLWIKYTSNTFEQLARLDKDAGLFSGQLIIIEKKNDDGTWPRNQRKVYRGIETKSSYPELPKTGSGGHGNRVEKATKELEDRSSSIKNMLLKGVKDVKDGVKNQYINKIEEIKRKIGDEEKSVETWNGKRKALKAKQASEKSNMKNEHKDEKKKMEKKHQDEEAIMEKNHRVEEEEMRKKYENDGLYLASLKEVRSQLARDVEKLDMTSDSDHKNLEDARQTLECPVCLEAMKPPMKIWMCPLSHIVCELCKNKLERRLCPSCRTNQVTQRAIVAENFARCVFNK